MFKYFLAQVHPHLPLRLFLFSLAAMSNLKGAETTAGNEKISPQDQAYSAAGYVEEPSLSYVKETKEVCADINNVAALGYDNVAYLEKKIVKRLDWLMLPQLWILYMFNYLNRTNIAQARLNTFDQDLNLQDGDYQVRAFGPGETDLTY
jgi:hypothetical protein